MFLANEITALARPKSGEPSRIVPGLTNLLLTTIAFFTCITCLLTVYNKNEATELISIDCPLAACTFLPVYGCLLCMCAVSAKASGMRLTSAPVSRQTCTGVEKLSTTIVIGIVGDNMVAE